MHFFKRTIAATTLSLPVLAIYQDGESTQPQDCRNINFTYPIGGACTFDQISTGPIGQSFLYRQVQSKSWPAGTPQIFIPLEETRTGGSFNAAAAVATLPRNRNVTDGLVIQYPTDGCGTKNGVPGCVWLKVAYTLYNVTSSGCERQGIPAQAFTVPFANIGNQYGGFYCMYGQDRCPTNGNGVKDFEGCWVKQLFTS